MTGKGKLIPPHFNGINDLARFFDETDSMELEGEEVDAKFLHDEGENDMEQISIRLPSRDLAVIRQAARRMGGDNLIISFH